MSFETQSGDLSAFTEVVPEAAQFGALERSSLLTARRRMKIVPQTGQSLGSAGAGAGSQQVQWLIADSGGMIDPRSVVINFNVQTTGTNAVPDDAHPFGTFQVLLNGQLCDNISSAARLTNMEMTLGGSKNYYTSAGSFQGFSLLNPDLNSSVPTASATTLLAGYSQYGYVTGNVPDASAVAQRTSSAVFGNQVGMPVSIPAGLISGLFRSKTYMPLSLLGEITIVAQTLSRTDYLFTTDATATPDYSLTNMSIEYDIVVPSSPYMSLLQRIASAPEEKGLNIPFESSIVGVGGAISTSSTQTEATIIVSRGTNYLLRSHVVQIPTAGLSAYKCPGQSLFSHAGLSGIQWRVGSQTFPNVYPSGDAAIFNLSLSAYGSPEQENGSCSNRALWGNSTNITTQGTAAVYETYQYATGGSSKFAYADRCVPCMGFQVVKGGASPLAVDGISLAGASGSQLVVSLLSAPGTAYTPFVSMVALRFIRAKSGAVQVVGA